MFLPLPPSLSPSPCTGPPLEVTIIGPNVTVVGNSVILNCTVDNEDLVDSYWWDFNVVVPAQTTGITDSVLQLNSIHPSQPMFTCVVTDIFGAEHRSDTLLLEIQGKDTRYPSSCFLFVVVCVCVCVCV